MPGGRRSTPTNVKPPVEKPPATVWKLCFVMAFYVGLHGTEKIELP